jgi:hypothetical protein
MADAINPFRFFSNISLLENDVGGFVEFTVRANELLRIEFITGQVRLLADQSPYILVTIRMVDVNGRDTGFFYVSSHKLGTFEGQDEFAQLVRLYADSRYKGHCCGKSRWGWAPRSGGSGCVDLRPIVQRLEVVVRPQK